MHYTFKLTRTCWFTATPLSTSPTSPGHISTSQIVALVTGVGSNALKVIAWYTDRSIIRVSEGWTGDNCREDKDHNNSVYNEQQYNVLSQVGSLPLQVPLA